MNYLQVYEILLKEKIFSYTGFQDKVFQFIEARGLTECRGICYIHNLEMYKRKVIDGKCDDGNINVNLITHSNKAKFIDSILELADIMQMIPIISDRMDANGLKIDPRIIAQFYGYVRNLAQQHDLEVTSDIARAFNKRSKRVLEYAKEISWGLVLKTVNAERSKRGHITGKNMNILALLGYNALPSENKDEGEVSEPEEDEEEDDEEEL